MGETKLGLLADLGVPAELATDIAEDVRSDDAGAGVDMRVEVECCRRSPTATKSSSKWLGPGLIAEPGRRRSA